LNGGRPETKESAAARRSEVGVLKAQVAGVLDELAFAKHRIDLLETSCVRRLDRLDDRVDGLAEAGHTHGALSTATPAS
jgi:hypothetical protein